MTKRPILLALCLLTACGGGGGGEEPTSIAEAIGMPDEQEFQQREREVQEALRSCMADEGFEYVPLDPSSMNIQIAGPGDRPPADFRDQYGYGVSTMVNVPGPKGGDEQPEDPNGAIREALSEADKEAYDRALYGDLATVMGGDDEGSREVRMSPDGAVSASGPGGEMIEPDDTGCFGRAQEDAGGGKPTFDPEVGRAFMELEERISSDARMVDAMRGWSSCMQDAGFDYESPREIREDLEARLEALRGPDDADGNPTGDEAGLARLQDEERATAGADDECWEEHLQDVEGDVRAEYEQEFLGDHPDLGQD